MATSSRIKRTPASVGEAAGVRAKRWTVLAESLYARTKYLHGLTKTSLRLLRVAALTRAESGPRRDVPTCADVLGVNLLDSQRWIVELAVKGPANEEDLGPLCRPVAAGRKAMTAIAMRLAAVLDIAQALDATPDPTTQIVAVHDDGVRLKMEIAGKLAAKNAAAAMAAADRWNHVAIRPVASVRVATKSAACPKLVRSDESMAQAGRRVFRRYIEQLLSRQYGLAYGDDIEFVHEMRVAIRRLRAAMRTFAKSFVGGLKKENQELKALADQLGEARDADVFVDFLRRYARRRSKPTRSALKSLIRSEKDSRGEAHQRLLAVCRSVGCQSFLRGFHQLVSQPKPDKETFAPTKRGQTRLVARGASKALRKELKRVLKFGDQLASLPPQRLHKLRIACKKLRYTAELFAEIYPPTFQDVIGLMVRLQDLLGTAHDADVYEDRLQKYLKESNAAGRDGRLAKAVRALVRFLSRRRARVLDQADRVWREFRSAKVQKPLKRMTEPGQ